MSHPSHESMYNCDCSIQVKIGVCNDLQRHIKIQEIIVKLQHLAKFLFIDHHIFYSYDSISPLDYLVGVQKMNCGISPGNQQGGTTFSTMMEGNLLNVMTAVLVGSHLPNYLFIITFCA